MKTGMAPAPSGFTLVELVMVIILIGVLSALGIGLFAGRSAFSPILASQQLASAALLAQQAGLAGNSQSSLEIRRDSEDFVFEVGTSPLKEFSIPHNGANLSVSGGLPLTINFNSDGGLTSGSNLNFTFTGESTFQTCLSSRGAVYQGSCQP